MKGLKYEYLTVDLAAGDNRNHGDLIGTKQLPTIVDGNFKCSQSMAILHYLDSLPSENASASASSQVSSNRIFPTCPKTAAKALEIAEIHNSFIQPLQNSRVWKKVASYGAENYDQVEWCQTFMYQGLDATEDLISEGGQFCLGDEITVADLFVYPMVVNCLTRHRVSLERYP